MLYFFPGWLLSESYCSETTLVVFSSLRSSTSVYSPQERGWVSFGILQAHRGGVDEAGVFHKVPRFDDSRLAEFFAREVLANLVRKELFSAAWAEMIHKVYEVDSLVCPQCGGTMKIIVFLTDHSVVDRIINHLKLTFVAQRPPPPQIASQELLMAAESSSEYSS